MTRGVARIGDRGDEGDGACSVAGDPLVLGLGLAVRLIVDDSSSWVS